MNMAESHLEMISPTCSAGRRMKSLNVHGMPHFARLTDVERQISREGCWYGEVLRPIWTHKIVIVFRPYLTLPNSSY